MCTAVSLVTKDHYFGRNLDYEHGFGEKIVVTPRNYPFRFRHAGSAGEHFAIIGMALPHGGYPLYFDAVNECGLCAAGLNFPYFAKYSGRVVGKDNIASFEVIPWLLCNCATIGEARALLEKINVTGDVFADDLPPTPLHWIISDKSGSLTLEACKDGVHTYENPVGVLTNSPSFDVQLINLSSYMSVSPDEPINNFSNKISLMPYSRGMGGVGLPGDLSAMSRFVRAAFTVLNSECPDSEMSSVSQFFHILGTVSQTRGCARVGGGFEITRYSSCCNAARGVYYYTTYENSRISAVDMHREDLDAREIITYDLCDRTDFFWQNQTALS